MRLRILLSALALVVLTGTYYYGYNKGTDDERMFVKQTILPLCYLMTLDKDQLAACLDQSI